ncbi:YqjF family protein [Streptomyces sp. NPDC088097]|uniref:YqjF family protein n=1 Tax=Streptomyces sp. NPDC088097 TaxID=3365823 RepID=UPI0037F2AE1E
MPSSVEPIRADPPSSTPQPLLTQSWLDLTLLHWAVDPERVAPLLPPGTVPDTLDGVTYVGLVPFRMDGVGWFRLPAVPYLGSFPETNVRLYSVDPLGRRGVVFRSLEAARLIPVVFGRAAFRLPYHWARMSVARSGDVLTYTSVRRRSGSGSDRSGARSRIRVRVGGPIGEPTELEHFLTARWCLHTGYPGGTLHLPNAHPRWPLHRAELLDCEEDLVAAAGLPGPLGAPASVLYSPGVPVRFGRPRRIPRPA